MIEHSVGNRKRRHSITSRHGVMKIRDAWHGQELTILTLQIPFGLGEHAVEVQDSRFKILFVGSLVVIASWMECSKMKKLLIVSNIFPHLTCDYLHVPSLHAACGEVDRTSSKPTDTDTLIAGHREQQ